MQSVIRFVDRFCTMQTFLPLILLYVAVFGGILITLGQLTEMSGGYGILDFDQGYDVTRVRAVFGSYDAAGMALYGRIQMLDLMNPALYSLIAAVGTRLLWRGRGPDWICLLPFLAGLGDYAENATLFLLSRAFPEIPEGLVAFSSALSLIKNGLMIVGFLPLIAGLMMLAVRLARRGL